MGFAADKFERAAFVPRKARVAVPALSAFFDEGETPEFEVRGLSAVELHKALEASRRQGSVESIVKAITESGDQAAVIRKALGLSDEDVPADVSRRIEMLAAGSVNPELGADRREQREGRAELAREMMDPEIGAVRAQFLGRDRQVDRLEQHVARRTGG
jgi:hypothetical protein